MKLSDRLLKIANNIGKDENVADIGTDHGFLPIYLKEINPNRNIILSDVSIPSLNKAKENCNILSPYEFDFRSGSGLQVLNENEVDTIVIAGMGGLLISKILEYDLNKSHSFSKYIFQPRNHSGELRYYLMHNGFNIIGNEIVKEGKFICDIIIAITDCKDLDSKLTELEPDNIELEIPVSLFDNDKVLLKEYLSRKLLRENRILLNIKRSNNPSVEQIDRIKNNILYIENMLEKL